ncbi:MAG TPA: sulfocyanin-like copper-binding protein [Gemmatimonadales bacterium]|nr:sulfocyanin-like copper-binding protein [Gemmatimonadales bacterium]
MKLSGCLGVLGVLTRALAAQSGSPPRIDSTWLVSDVPTKTVQFQLIAGFSGLNGALNFNGFGDGGLTFTVPAGWHVVIHFTNHDGMLAHSAVVIADSVVPTAGASSPAFSQAVTLKVQEGLTTTERDDMKFVADKAGSYLLICGVPGHAAAGMWIRFKVAAGAERPLLAATAQQP